MALTNGQRDARRAGGKAVVGKKPPALCSHCGRSMVGRSWHSYLGHLSVHKLGDNNGWSYEEAARQFVAKGLRTQDPAPWNGAWTNYNVGGQ